jgi:hypothetical protein
MNEEEGGMHTQLRVGRKTEIPLKGMAALKVQKHLYRYPCHSLPTLYKGVERTERDAQRQRHQRNASPRSPALKAEAEAQMIKRKANSHSDTEQESGNQANH